MSSLRNAYLDVLGIDRWVPRGAEDPVELAAPEARRRARSRHRGAHSGRFSARQDAGHPLSARSRGR